MVSALLISVWMAAQMAEPKMNAVPWLSVRPWSKTPEVKATPSIETKIPSQAKGVTRSRPVITPNNTTRIGTHEISIEPVPASTVCSPKLIPRLYSVNAKRPSREICGISRNAGRGRPRKNQTINITVDAMR